MILYNSEFVLQSKHHNASLGHILCLKELERILGLWEENILTKKKWFQKKHIAITREKEREGGEREGEREGGERDSYTQFLKECRPQEY